MIDVGVAPRALEVSVNPMDQILLSYVTDTASTGRPKMLYCDVGCTSPRRFSGDDDQSLSLRTRLVVAAIVGTGAAWCQVSPTQYYPMVAYNVTGQTKFAVCRQAIARELLDRNQLDHPIRCRGWKHGHQTSVDATVVGDVPKVATYNGANLIVYKMGTTACTAAPAAFTASGNLGNYGTSWINFLKDPTNGYFHLIANSGTTNVEYLNTSSTNPIGAWNAASAADTVTLPAVGAVAGGAAINSSAARPASSFLTE